MGLSRTGRSLLPRSPHSAGEGERQQQGNMSSRSFQVMASGTQKRKQGDTLGRTHENVAPVVRAVRRAPEVVAFGRAGRRKGAAIQRAKGQQASQEGTQPWAGMTAHSRHRSESRRRMGWGGQAPAQPWGLPIWKHL